MILGKEDGNRIVQPGEIDLGDNALDDVVTSAPGAGGSNIVTPNQGGALNVDMLPLDNLLLNLLTHAVKDHSKYFDKDSDFIPKPVIGDKTKALVTILGNSFFTMENLRYHEHKNILCLMGELTLSTELPLKSLKIAIEKSLGSEYVDYFIQQFGPRLGITDDTKPVDLTKPDVQEYIPGFAEIKKLSAFYFIPNIPHMLLLSLSPEERKYATLMFNEARTEGINPFNVDYKKVMMPDADSKYVIVDKYAMTPEKMAALIEEPNIVPFIQLVKAGKKYGVTDLPEYFDRLQKFKETLQNIKIE